MSADPADNPLVQPNLLESTYDFDTLVEGVRLARRVLRTKAFQPYFVSERNPGPDIDNEDGLREYVRNAARICFHASGSAKMGTDGAAVVDPRLRVIGVNRLRVVDSSVIPQLPSGNINAISMVIGEKGSDLILVDRRNASSTFTQKLDSGTAVGHIAKPSVVSKFRAGHTDS
jgi:choline dehydrogenase